MACARSASRTRGARSARGDDALGNNEKNAYRRWRYFNEAEVRRATRRARFAPSGARTAAWRRCVPSSRVRGLESSLRGATRVLEWSRLDKRPDRRGNGDILFRQFRLSEFRSFERRPWNFGSVPAIFAAVDGAFRRANWRQNIAFPTQSDTDRIALSPRSPRLARCPAPPRKPKRRASRCEAGRPG